MWPQGSLGGGNAVTTDPKPHAASCEMKHVLAKADLVQLPHARGLSWVRSVGEDGSWFVTEPGFCMSNGNSTYFNRPAMRTHGANV